MLLDTMEKIELVMQVMYDINKWVLNHIILFDGIIIMCGFVFAMLQTLYTKTCN